MGFECAPISSWCRCPYLEPHFDMHVHRMAALRLRPDGGAVARPDFPAASHLQIEQQADFEIVPRGASGEGGLAPPSEVRISEQHA